jgi:LPXTG-motif cell wall-anchored protein
MAPPASGEQPGGPQGFATPTPHSNSTLPSTGSNVADVMLYAGALLLLGLGLMVMTRRRPVTPAFTATVIGPRDDDIWTVVPPED